MEYQVFTDMTQVTAAEVERLLPLVSAQRRAEALRYKHVFGQFCCLKSYRMLCELFRDAGASPDYLPEFTYNEHGKPFLSSSNIQFLPLCFSISHTKAAIAVAMDSQPIGIDVETIVSAGRIADGELIRRTMNESEQTRIAASDDPAREFTRLWTQKEAVLKMIGTGIGEIPLSEILTSPFSINEPKELLTFDYPDFVLSIALR